MKEEIDYNFIHHMEVMKSKNNSKKNWDKEEVFESVLNFIALNPEITETCRKRCFVDQRQFICFLLRKYTDLSLRSIGLLIGGKNHATVIHGIKSHEALFSQKDTEYLYNNRQLIEIFENAIK